MGSIRCGRYVIETSHEDKILFTPTPITKGALINYYTAIASVMLPYMKNHPLTMLRYPNGIDHEGFYQKDTPDYFPSWIDRITIKKKEGGSTTYVVCNNKATLVYLANQSCITPHLWLSRADKLDYPDRMIFDIDPAERTNFSTVRMVALRLKKILEDLDLTPFAMTTGSHGMHVIVPLNRRANFDTVRTFARTVAEILVADDPKNITLELNKAKRKNRIFLDYLRNGFGATGVAPYAVRPKPGAPVATPITWQEVHDTKLTSQRYNITTIFNHLKKNPNPWKSFHTSACSIAKASVLLKKIKKNS